jgi:hypothetical protein
MHLRRSTADSIVRRDDPRDPQTYRQFGDCRIVRLQAYISTLAGQKRQVARQRSISTTAPVAPADATDTRPRHPGYAAHPF